MADITIYTDGGSRGNPGQAGSGAVIYDNNQVLAEISEFLGVQTNNWAEYQAIILALEKVVALGLVDKTIEVRADSKLAVEQLSGNWKVKNAGVREQYNTVQDIIRRHNLSVAFTHVRREYNKVADALANKAMDSGV